MLIRLRKLQNDLRSSLFFVPMLFVIGAVVLGETMLRLDERVGDVPTRLTATVDSSRNVLGVVASATLAFAGIAFSVSLLLISLASSQFSPRVVLGLFRDPFNKRVMGIVIGTFTYCLVVMRAVRESLGDDGQPIVPSVSILLAVALGIISVLAIIAFISHSAHSMDVSKILHRVTDQALDELSDSSTDQPAGDGDEDLEPPSGAGFAVTFDGQGWIQEIDHGALLASLEPGGCIRLATTAGRYAVPNTALCTVWPEPDDPDAVRRSVRAAVVLGEARTLQQDVTYGVRQLADVALKALSPGVNDPTTAQDALFHLGTVVQALLVRNAPSRRLVGPGDCVLLLPEAVTHDDIVGLAFDEVRIASAGQPTVQIYLLEILHLLSVSIPDDRDDAREALARQADLVLEISEQTELPDGDRERVRSAHTHRFG